MQRLKEDAIVTGCGSARRGARRDMGARMYMPEIGRFLSVDPLAEAFPTQSPYNFAYNNPINFRDPSGLAPEKEKGDKVLGTATNPGLESSNDDRIFAESQAYFAAAMMEMLIQMEIDKLIWMAESGTRLATQGSPDGKNSNTNSHDVPFSIVSGDNGVNVATFKWRHITVNLTYNEAKLNKAGITVQKVVNQISDMLDMVASTPIGELALSKVTELNINIAYTGHEIWEGCTKEQQGRYKNKFVAGAYNTSGTFGITSVKGSIFIAFEFITKSDNEIVQGAYYFRKETWLSYLLATPETLLSIFGHEFGHHLDRILGNRFNNYQEDDNSADKFKYQMLTKLFDWNDSWGK